VDPAETGPFELGQGDDACLLVHGFTGTPWDVRPLGEGLAGLGYYVRAVRLPGHGDPVALAQVTHRDWEQVVEDALLSLGNFRHLFVAGLSMGALLALTLAARHPNRVHGLALLSPALHLRDPRLKLARLLRRWPVLPIAAPRIRKRGTDIDDPRERALAPRLPYFPTARLNDLWTIQDAARAALPQVQAPALIAVSRQDHVIDARGAGRELARGLSGSPLVRFIELPEGFHVMTRGRGRALVIDEVAQFFGRLRM
jgi:carboxylesterase